MKDIENPIYLDNNATTMVAPEVVEAMLPHFSPLYGNASSMHTFGGQMKKYIDNARQEIADTINAEPDEIIFTSCGTESDNTAFHSSKLTQPNKNIFITTSVEHSAVIHSAKKMESDGKKVIWLEVDEFGRLDLEKFKQTVKENANDIALVSIMHANNETGTLFPIEKIAEITKEHNILFHVDAVQSITKEVIDVKKTPIDFMAFSGHKIHAPKGIGVLYLRRGTRFRPFMIGGHQEEGKRAGTENVPYIVGLGKAFEIAKVNAHDEHARVKSMRDRLQKGLLEAIDNAKINGDEENRLVNTLNISMKNIEGEALLLMLNTFGICASSGSACTSGSLEPSHVLRAMGVPYNYAHGSLRFSLSRYTKEEEVDKVLEVLPKIVTNLRAMSPFKD